MVEKTVEKTVARTSLGVVKTSLGVVKTYFSGGDEDISGGGEDISGGGKDISANHSSSASRSNSSRGSAAALNAVTRCSIHCISNIFQSGRGSLSGSFVSR